MEMKSVKDTFEKLFGLKEGDYFNIVGNRYNPYLVRSDCIVDSDWDDIEDEAITHVIKNPSSVESIENPLVKVVVNDAVYLIRQVDIEAVLEVIEEYSEECENQPNETDITDTAPPIQRF